MAGGVADSRQPYEAVRGGIAMRSIAMKTPRVALAALLAPLLLALTGVVWAGATYAQDAAAPAAGAACTPAPAPVPVKPMTFVIHNSKNSKKTLYPVISTGQPPWDKWMQAEFQVCNPVSSPRKYPESYLYRIYINGVNGIPPGGSVTVTLPMWSQLVSDAPDGSKPDEYVDWWNGQRLGLFDDPTEVKKLYDADVASNTDFEGPIAGSPMVTCKGCDISQQRVFRAKAAFLENIHGQLTEYTLAVVNETVNPFTINDQVVGYNISYVDSVYLPVAMEPYGNAIIGYVGTVQSTGAFTGAINSFLKTPAYAGWPTFLDASKKPIAKVPSAGYIFASQSGPQPSPIVSKPGVTINNMIANWKACTLTQKDPGEACGQVRDVQALFLANYDSYVQKWTAQKCVGKVRPLKKGAGYDYNWLLDHVYGFSAFNETPLSAKCGQIVNDLNKTPKYASKFLGIVNEYKLLQYTPDGVLPDETAFNAYVALIHGSPPQKFLNMPYAYAFSIDDAVGFMLQKGTGLVYAVGGADGLANPKPYDPKFKVNVNFSQNQPIKFTNWGACESYTPGMTCAPTESLNGDATFALYLERYPILVTMVDSNNKTYQFVLNKKPYWTKTPSHAPIDCPVTTPWCGALTAKSNPPNPPEDLNYQNYVEAQPPS
jgi:hypothetical protein